VNNKQIGEETTDRSDYKPVTCKEATFRVKASRCSYTANAHPADKSVLASCLKQIVPIRFLPYFFFISSQELVK
jgi:hypothetical protein